MDTGLQTAHNFMGRKEGSDDKRMEQVGLMMDQMMLVDQPVKGPQVIKIESFKSPSNDYAPSTQEQQ